MGILRRCVGLLLHMFVISLLVSLVMFLLSTPTIPQEETSDIFPWEQYEDDLMPFKGSKRNLQEALEGTNIITNPNTKLVPAARKRRFEYSVVQESRHNVLESACEAAANHSWNDLTDEQRQAITQRMVVNDEHKLLYCPIPLSGNGPWMKVMYFIGENGKDISDITKVPSKALGNRKNFVYLNSYSREEQDRRISTYLKFMVTRHPLLRIAIAYKLKFETDNTFFHERYGKDIVKKYRHGAGSNPSGKDVKFSEFVQYLAGVLEERNEHWESLDVLCRPCEVNYDFILHHETLHQDASEVLDQALLSDYVPMFPHDNWDSIPIEYVHGLFKKVTPASVGQLVKQYSHDFAMFSYASLF